MTENEIVTIRVKKALKQKAKKYNIDISKTARSAIEEEIKKREEQELSQALTDIKGILQKIPDQEIVKAIRESRDQR
jgi:antitoxin CcdA